MCLRWDVLTSVSLGKEIGVYFNLRWLRREDKVDEPLHGLALTQRQDSQLVAPVTEKTLSAPLLENQM